MASTIMESFLSYLCETPPPTMEQCQELLAASNPDDPAEYYRKMAFMATATAAVPIGILARKIKQKLQSKDVYSDSLLEQLKALQEEIMKHQTLEESLRQQISTLEEHSDKQDKFEKSLLGKIVNLQLNMNNYQQDLVFANSQNKDLAARSAHLLAFTENSELVGAQHEDMLSLSLSLLDEYSKNLVAADQMSVTCSNKNKVLQEQLSRMSNIINIKDEQVALFKGALNSLGGKVELTMKENISLQREIARQEREIKDKDSDCIQLQEHISTLNYHIAEKEKESAVMQDKLKTLSMASSKLVDHTSELENAHQEISERCERIIKEKMELEEKYSMMESISTALVTEMKPSLSDIINMNEEHPTPDAEAENVKSLTEQISALNHHIAEKEKEFAKMRSDMLEMERTNQPTIAKLDEEHQDLLDKLEKASMANSKLLERTTTLENALKEISELNECLTKEKEEDDNRYSLMVGINNALVEEMRTRYNDILNMNEERVQRFAKVKSSFDKKMETMDQKCQEFEIKCTTKDKQTEKLKTILARLSFHQTQQTNVSRIRYAKASLAIATLASHHTEETWKMDPRK